MQFSTPIFSISILLGVVAAQSREVGSRDLSPQGPPALRLGAGLCCSQCWGGWMWHHGGVGPQEDSGAESRGVSREEAALTR